MNRSMTETGSPTGAGLFVCVSISQRNQTIFRDSRFSRKLNSDVGKGLCEVAAIARLFRSLEFEVRPLRLVKLGKVQPGTRLGRSVLTEDGRVLLPSGVELTPGYIRSLAAHAVDAIYVVEPDVPPAAIGVVSRATHQDLAREMTQVMREISSSFTQASRGIKFPSVAFRTEVLKKTVDRVVNEVMANPRALVTLQDIRQWDEYTMLHSIEVCILSTMVGNGLGLSRTELGELAMAALLHDIGKTAIPLEGGLGGDRPGGAAAP